MFCAVVSCGGVRLYFYLIPSSVRRGFQGALQKQWLPSEHGRVLSFVVPTKKRRLAPS